MSQPPVSFPTLQQQHPAAFAPTGYPFHQQQQQQHAQQQIHPQQIHQQQFFANPSAYAQPQVRTPQQQQQQHLINQQQQQQQQQQHHQAYAHGGPVQLHGGAPMNPMMMAGGFPQHNNPMAQAGFSQGYSQGVPTSMGQTSMPMTLSPHTTTMPAQAQPQQASTAATQNPLYSTPTRPSQNPALSQMQNQSPATTPPAAPPVSPAQVARDRARVTVLLDINSALIEEVVNLQANGKAGAAPNQPPSQQASPIQEANTGSPSTPADNSEVKTATPTTATKPSMEYIECMRRLQGNLAFLAILADRKKAGSQAPQSPAFMNPPPHLTSINDLYAKLNELFPNAKGSAPQTPHGQQLPNQHARMQSQHQQPQSSDGQTATPTETAG